MAARTVVVAVAVATVIAVGTEVAARAPAPLVPTALVEDVKSVTANVEFMDYVDSGRVIRLEANDVLVLSYLKSCEHETITGGTVRVGLERSDVREGKVVRAKVPCDGGKMQLTAEQASQSAASAFRLQSAKIQQTLYAWPPVIQLPRLQAGDGRTLLIERADRSGERYRLQIDDAVAAAGFYDLAGADAKFAPGAAYDATIGDDHKARFRIDEAAKPVRAPIVSRLVRFP